MLIDIDLKQLSNPLYANVIGELLRGCVFDQADGRLGCYETFTVNHRYVVSEFFDHVQDRTKGILELFDESLCFQYFCDGDSTLRFIFNNGDILENNDCKKTDGWRLVPAATRSVE